MFRAKSKCSFLCSTSSRSRAVYQIL